MFVYYCELIEHNRIAVHTNKSFKFDNVGMDAKWNKITKIYVFLLTG